MAREAFNNPNSPVQPGFMSGTARQYLGMRNFAQNNRAKALEQQTAQLNMRKAVFEQATSEMEFMQKQQDRLRSDKVRMANASLYNDLSEQMVAFNENPGQFSDSDIMNMVTGWSRLRNSEAFSKEAEFNSGMLQEAGQIRYRKQIADNGLEFNSMQAGGKAFLEEDFDKIPQEQRDRYKWGKKQISTETDPETGMERPVYGRFLNGLNEGFLLTQKLKLQQFAVSDILPDDQKIPFDKILSDPELQFAAANDEDFAKMLQETIDDIAEERRGIRKEERAEAEEIRKEEREAGKPAKVVYRAGVEDPETGAIDTVTITGNALKNIEAKKKLGLNVSQEEEDSVIRGFINETLEANSGVPFVSRILSGDRRDIDMGGGKSGTHFMSTMSADGKHFAFPMIQDVNGELLRFDNANKAFDNAMKNRNVVAFDSLDSAKMFSENMSRLVLDTGQVSQAGTHKFGTPSDAFK